MMHKNLVSITFVLFILLANHCSSDNNFKELSYSTTLSKAVTQVIQDFYIHKSSTLLITKSSLNIHNYLNQMGFLNEILYHIHSQIVVSIEDYWCISSTMQRYYSLMFIDSYEAFSQIFKTMRNDSLFDYTGYYTIVLTETPRDGYIIISNILNDCWSIYITNVVILTSLGSQLNSNSAIYTYFPYTVYHCEKVAPVVLNYFTKNAFLYKIEHFPDKLSNMHMCPLTVVTQNVTPFMILFRDKNNGDYQTEGIDGVTFRLLSKQLNFTPIVKVLSKANGSSLFMEMVRSGQANLTIGGFSFTVARAKLMSASSPYLHSALLFAVPKGRSYSAFEKLFLPFEARVWLSIGTILVLAFVTTNLLSEKKLKFLVGERIATPFLNTILILYGGSLTVLPKRNFARSVLMTWIIGCIVLRSAFQGSLFDAIQKHKHSPSASTFSDLIARNYTLYMTTSIFHLFTNTSKYRKNFRIHNFGPDERYEVLLNSDFKGAVLTTDVGISYYNMKHFATTGVVSSTKDRAFLLPFCIFFRKHSCLHQPITNQIDRYTSSGLLDYWISQYFQKNFFKVKSSQFANQQLQRLNMEQLSGGFFLSFFMLIFSTFIFLAELISVHIGFVKKIVALPFS